MEVGSPPSPWQRNSVLREEFRGLIVARTDLFLFLGHVKGASPTISLLFYKDDDPLSTPRRHSFFQRQKKAVNKQKRGPSQQKEKEPATAPRPFSCYGTSFPSPGSSSSRLKIEKGFRKSLPPLLSVNIDGKETDITSLLLPVHTPLFQALRDLTPAEMGSNLSFPPFNQEGTEE